VKGKQYWVLDFKIQGSEFCTSGFRITLYLIFLFSIVQKLKQLKKRKKQASTTQ